MHVQTEKIKQVLLGFMCKLRLESLKEKKEGEVEREREREHSVCLRLGVCVCESERARMGRSLCWQKFIFCFLKDDREGKQEKSCAATIAKEEKLVFLLSGKPLNNS